MAKGYKLVITRYLGLPAKYNYSASASPRPRIVFCLQPSEVGCNYYLHINIILLEALSAGAITYLSCRSAKNFLILGQVRVFLDTEDLVYDLDSLEILSLIFLSTAYSHLLNTEVDTFSLGAQLILYFLRPSLHIFKAVTQLKLLGSLNFGPFLRSFLSFGLLTICRSPVKTWPRGL